MAWAGLSNGLKAKALEALAAQNSELLCYRMVFADAEVDPRDVTTISMFLQPPG